MQKSIAKRVKITKQGKLKHRATTLGHSRGNKSQKEYLRKKGMRNLSIKKKTIKKYI